MTAKFAFVGSSQFGDTVTVTNAQFESGLSLSAIKTSAEALETVIIADVATITDAAFANVSQFGTVQLGDFTNSVTLGTNAAADAASIFFGAFRGGMTVDDSAAEAGTISRSMPAVSEPPRSWRYSAVRVTIRSRLRPLNSTISTVIFFGFAGSDTVDVFDTASLSHSDADVTALTTVEKLHVAPGAGGVAAITLGALASTDVSAHSSTGVLTVDATGESATGSTVVDFSAMTAKFAFDGGAGNDTVSITSTQFATAPHIAGGGGSDTLVITDTGATLVDADFANVGNIQTLEVQSADITLGADASAEIGASTLLVDASGESAFAVTNVDFTAMTAKFAFAGGSFIGDTVTVTNAQFESGLSLSAASSFGFAVETIVISDAADITDAAFANVTQFVNLKLGDFTNNVTLGADASADAASIGGGSSEMVVNDLAATAGHDLTLDVSGFDVSDDLSVSGGAGDDLFEAHQARGAFTSGNFRHRWRGRVQYDQTDRYREFQSG